MAARAARLAALKLYRHFSHAGSVRQGSVKDQVEPGSFRQVPAGR